MNNYDKMMKKLEDEERQGTINDIENLVEDSYENMYHELANNYNYIKEENEIQREQIQEMLSDIWKIECEEIIEEMNTLINEKMKKINEIVKKYK